MKQMISEGIHIRLDAARKARDADGKWFCTDCLEHRKTLRPDGRCPVCGGARVVKNED